MMKRIALLALGLALPAFGTEWFVDNVGGDDANPGTAEKPVRTFAKARSLLKGGDTLFLVPNKEPYTERFGAITPAQSGTLERPTVIDGRGATLTRMEVVPKERWAEEENGVWKMASFPNNVVTMTGQGYYSGFPFVFVDGEPLKPVKSLELLTPGTCLLVLKWDMVLKKPDALHKALFIKLPEGKTLENSRIEAPGLNGLEVSGDYVVVKNINALWSSSDLFDSSRGKGIVMENLRVTKCMDQCISAHSTADQEVRFSLCSEATAGGVLDVTFQKTETYHTRYYGTIFERNAMCGAGFQGGNGLAELTSCIMRGNAGPGAMARQNIKLKIKDSYILRGEGKAIGGVSVWDTAEIEMENCTIDGFENAFVMGGKSKIKLVNCRIINCKKVVLHLGEAPGDRISGSGNFIGDAVPGSAALPEGFVGEGKGTTLTSTMTLDELRAALEKK